jgi:hypothetical protein
VLPGTPSRGPNILKFCIWVPTRRFPSRPLCGSAPSRPGSSNRDYPRMMCEITRPGFAPEGGAYAPIWSYGEVCIHAGSHLPMVTQGTLRSRLGIAVPSLRPLASSWMREPRQLDKYPISSTPSDYRNTWGRGLCVHYIFSDNPDRSRDFMTCQLKSK